MITADTITDEQIRELRTHAEAVPDLRKGTHLLIVYYATTALGESSIRHGVDCRIPHGLETRYIHEGRARCAEILTLEELLNGPGPLCCGCSVLLTDAEVDVCTPGCDEYCAACRVKEENPVSTEKLYEAWKRLANRYRALATERADEGASVQLGCLVLAEHCAHEWSTDLGGPTPEMVALAEHVVGEYLDEMIASELKKDAS